MNLLFIGDIFGSPGRSFLKELLPELLKDYQIDLAIANGENAAGGVGLTGTVAEEIFSAGVDVITSGNHIWHQKEIYPLLETEERILRPANYPPGVPGKGSAVYRARDGTAVGVINVCGRTYSSQHFDCPFRALDAGIDKIRAAAPVIVIDFHGEASSEKIAAGWYVDGRASALLGTHTHVQTADELILPGGTAYITDAGMTGSYEGVIGADREAVLKHFLTQLPVRIKPAGGKRQFSAVYCAIHPSGKSEKIERILIRE
ncbi:MAG TPA: TIGR00282 family metallophosphoesterase [Bacillota bacterium]|jgi:metallophosphoesterase (TIGR00282 family)|nr:TIGR00282 family metallophosphoesterase [Bacillota bacterium]HOA34774.1 TIGR00282 family metallophosphoesterase [Bacillota bacterium]HPZ12204.1 TIGR00282 family metallophosphoesterase [Bacillota bacterium]HQE10494.1 TIGR00282 family metallophosphoesterase [Bacillota bacterium]